MRLMILAKISLLFILITSCSKSYELPEGWYAAGSHPKDYEMGTDEGAGISGNNAATIKSKNDEIPGFGTLMQGFAADKYKNQRLRLSGNIKSDDVKNWAGFWMRVDQKGSDTPLAFDNMHTRPIKGTIDWKKCEIVLDIPESASYIAFGALLNGSGQIWFDELKFDIVDSTVASTDMLIGLSKTPGNLDFDR